MKEIFKDDIYFSWDEGDFVWWRGTIYNFCFSKIERNLIDFKCDRYYVYGDTPYFDESIVDFHYDVHINGKSVRDLFCHNMQKCAIIDIRPLPRTEGNDMRYNATFHSLDDAMLFKLIFQ